MKAVSQQSQRDCCTCTLSVQCFRNPLRLLPAIKTKQQYSKIWSRGGTKCTPVGRQPLKKFDDPKSLHRINKGQTLKSAPQQDRQTLKKFDDPSCRIPARQLTSLKLFQNLRSLFPTPAPTLRNQSALLKHLTYPSVALHVPDVVPLPRHHERVHRHLPAQPRRKASKSVRAASCGQCFWNPVHVLSPIKTKRRYSECSGARARLRSTGMHNTLAIRLTYSLYRSIPFFNSMNFPSKISCSTCLHGIRCSLLTSDASITRKVVWG